MMHLRDACDVAYALMVEREERRALAYISGGAEIDPDDVREQLDAWLASPLPKATGKDREREELLRAVGLRR